MILGYRDSDTRAFAEGCRIRAFQGFERQAAKRLSILNAAPSLDTLRGDRAGQYSIRINRQWRLCFEWPQGRPGPQNVKIVDYHE